MAEQTILSMEGISKYFPGVKALEGVQLELKRGEVHALLGENGAGKSTLMKILAGIYKPDTGTMTYKNENVVWSDPLDARSNGISVIHQELNIASNMSIAENILLGTPLPKNRLGLVDWTQVNNKVEHFLRTIDSELHPQALVSSLSVAEQQMIEIVRAISFNTDVLIMDEPTATLTAKEIDKLFSIIRDLKQQGVAIIYISHRMEEIFQIADQCTVLRDGEWVSSLPVEETSSDHLIQLMVGRELKDLFQRPNQEKNLGERAPVLEVKEMTDTTKVTDAQLQVYPGEVVGVSGLVGAGRTELSRAIFGSSDLKSGKVWVNGQSVDLSSPGNAINQGVALVPESRKEQGLFLDMSVKENILMAVKKRYQKLGALQWRKLNRLAQEYIEKLNIKVASPDQKVVNLSGGNQQKVVIARWLCMNPNVLLLDEPTRGVDVGAKSEIYKIIHELAAEGLGVLLISSELPEILGVSDRVLVMHEGKIRANLPREEATQERIMYYAMGEIA